MVVGGTTFYYGKKFIVVSLLLTNRCRIARRALFVKCSSIWIERTFTARRSWRRIKVIYILLTVRFKILLRTFVFDSPFCVMITNMRYLHIPQHRSSLAMRDKSTGDKTALLQPLSSNKGIAWWIEDIFTARKTYIHKREMILLQPVAPPPKQPGIQRSSNLQRQKGKQSQKRGHTRIQRDSPTQ